MQFKQGDVFLRKNAIHSFENALLGGCHFSRIPQIGLMSVARFSWVPNLYNIHFLVENHRPQPDPVNSYRDIYIYIFLYNTCMCVCRRERRMRDIGGERGREGEHF